MIDNVMLYALLGSLALYWVFDFWVAGQSDED
jgi:hypothetical protein